MLCDRVVFENGVGCVRGGFLFEGWGCRSLRLDEFVWLGAVIALVSGKFRATSFCGVWYHCEMK